MQHVYCIDWTCLWLVVSMIVNFLQTGLLTSELVWYCRYSWINLYCNEWLLVLTSRDVNHPISWHPWCDVISDDFKENGILNWNFEVKRFTVRIVFCQVFRICKLKSIYNYTAEKLYRWTIRSAWSPHHHWLLWVWIVFEKIFWPFITDQDYFEFLSSHLKFDSGRSILSAANSHLCPQ